MVKANPIMDVFMKLLEVMAVNSVCRSMVRTAEIIKAGVNPKNSPILRVNNRLVVMVAEIRAYCK